MIGQDVKDIFRQPDVICRIAAVRAAVVTFDFLRILANRVRPSASIMFLRAFADLHYLHTFLDSLVDLISFCSMGLDHIQI